MALNHPIILQFIKFIRHNLMKIKPNSNASILSSPASKQQSPHKAKQQVSSPKAQANRVEVEPNPENQPLSQQGDVRKKVKGGLMAIIETEYAREMGYSKREVMKTEYIQNMELQPGVSAKEMNQEKPKKVQLVKEKKKIKKSLFTIIERQYEKETGEKPSQSNQKGGAKAHQTLGADRGKGKKLEDEESCQSDEPSLIESIVSSQTPLKSERGKEEARKQFLKLKNELKSIIRQAYLQQIGKPIKNNNQEKKQDTDIDVGPEEKVIFAHNQTSKQPSNERYKQSPANKQLAQSSPSNASNLKPKSISQRTNYQPKDDALKTKKFNTIQNEQDKGYKNLKEIEVKDINLRVNSTKTEQSYRRNQMTSVMRKAQNPKYEKTNKDHLPTMARSIGVKEVKRVSFEIPEETNKVTYSGGHKETHKINQLTKKYEFRLPKVQKKLHIEQTRANTIPSRRTQQGSVHNLHKINRASQLNRAKTEESQFSKGSILERNPTILNNIDFYLKHMKEEQKVQLIHGAAQQVRSTKFSPSLKTKLQQIRVKSPISQYKTNQSVMSPLYRYLS